MMALTASPVEASSVTSSLTSSTPCKVRVSLRTAPKTRKPLLASSCAVASPIPDDTPVIRTVLFIVFLLSLTFCRRVGLNAPPAFGTAPCSSVSRRGSGLSATREEQDNRGDHKHHANDRESVAESQNEGLALDQLAKLDDGLMPGGFVIGNAMRREVVGQGLDPLPHLVPGERHRLADDVRVELLALGDDGGKRRRPDRAAEIA